MMFMVYGYRNLKTKKTIAISEDGRMLMEFDSLPTEELDRHEVNLAAIKKKYPTFRLKGFMWIGWNDGTYNPLRRALSIFKTNQNRKAI